jgi:uncharacterized protein
LPSSFDGVSYEPVTGWTAKVSPGQVAWTADSDADGIKPGQFRDFPLSVKIPGEEGDSLTFKALQTYSDGDVVRWIGAPDSDNPAPVVAVTAAQEGDHGANVASAEHDEPADDADASKGLGIAALIIGALGLVAGATAIVLSRRK